MSDATKRCALCGLELPISDFKRDARTRDSLSYRCLVCLKLQRRKGYSQLVRQVPIETIVPISTENGSDNAPKTSDQNERADTFVSTHPHGDQ